MPNNFDDFGRPAGSDFAIHTLDQVDTAAYQLPTPSFVPDAVVPESLAGKRRIRSCAISDEAACRMSIHSQKEWHEQMMRVPERLVRLLANLLVRGGVHHEHTEQHDVAGDAASLRIMYLYSCLRPDLGALNVEETCKVSDPLAEYNHWGTYFT